MSAPLKNTGEGPKRPPESSQSPSSKKLRETVRFYEKVWTGTGSPGVHGEAVQMDVDQLERRLAEERGTKSPQMAYATAVGPDGGFQAGFTKIVAMRLISSKSKTILTIQPLNSIDNLDIHNLLND